MQFVSVIYFCLFQSWIFSILLQSSVSHDPSEIILNADLLLKKHFLLLSMLKTVVLLNMFVETMIIFPELFDE